MQWTHIENACGNAPLKKHNREKSHPIPESAENRLIQKRDRNQLEYFLQRPWRWASCRRGDRRCSWSNWPKTRFRGLRGNCFANRKILQESYSCSGRRFSSLESLSNRGRQRIGILSRFFESLFREMSEKKTEKRLLITKTYIFLKITGSREMVIWRSI